MKIRHVEGLHLTATNKRHMRELLEAERMSGSTGQLSYRLEPIAEQPDHYRYQIDKRERDDWNRPQTRTSRGIIHCVRKELAA